MTGTLESADNGYRLRIRAPLRSFPERMASDHRTRRAGPWFPPGEELQVTESEPRKAARRHLGRR